MAETLLETPVEGTDAPSVHPLSMMTEAEAHAAIEVLRRSGRIGDGARFHGFCIAEPPKDEVAAWTPGTQTDRRFEVVVHENGEVHIAVVSVTRGEVDSWTHHPGVVPRVGMAELFAVMDACRKDPGFAAALAKRGITDPSQVQIDPWPTGDYDFDFEIGRRLLAPEPRRQRLRVPARRADGAYRRGHAGSAAGHRFRPVAGGV